MFFIRYLFKKSLEWLASLSVLVALSFFLLKILPGGPFDEDAALHPLVKEKLSQQWHIQDSWSTQAGSYFLSMVRGDLGVSLLRPERSVVEIMRQGLQNTLALNILALIVVVSGSLLLSLLAVRFSDSWFEKLVDQVVIIGLSLPSLFWGPLLIYIFGFYFDLLPVAFLSSPWHYLLPLLTLSLRPLASLVRILKKSMKDNLALDYVRTAKSKGLTPWRILLGHVLRNSLIPFLSYLGPLIVGLLSGSFLVEMLFSIPGLGSEFIIALNDRDYTLIVGLTLFYGVLLISVNMILDIVLKCVDPRLREPT